jgi:hypothetical protein
MVIVLKGCQKLAFGTDLEIMFTELSAFTKICPVRMENTAGDSGSKFPVHISM